MVVGKHRKGQRRKQRHKQTGNENSTKDMRNAQLSLEKVSKSVDGWKKEAAKLLATSTDKKKPAFDANCYFSPKLQCTILLGQFLAVFGLGFGEANFVVDCCCNSKDSRVCTVCRLATIPKIWQQRILQNKTHLAQVLRLFFVVVFLLFELFDLVVVVVGGGPVAFLDAGVGGLDTTPINAVFQASAAGPGEAVDPNSDEILLENRYYPCVLKVTFVKKESRLKQVSELKGLDERFLSLSVGAKYRIGTRVQVELCNPGGVALFRPGRTNEKALARLLVISKRVVPNTNHTYIYFLFAYKSENGSVRVTVCTKEWVHGVVPEAFQILLNANKDALLPSRWSPNQFKSSWSQLGRSCFRVRSSSWGAKLKWMLHQLVSAKAEISEQDTEIAKLKLDDVEAKKNIDNALAALDEERKAKLAIESKHKFFINQQLVIKRERDEAQEALQGKQMRSGRLEFKLGRRN
eukprot:g28386.t1